MYICIVYAYFFESWFLNTDQPPHLIPSRPKQGTESKSERGHWVLISDIDRIAGRPMEGS